MEERNVRGFVFKIEIGRAGLVVVELVFSTGTHDSFVIEDLDADPERFNERLSMLGIVRDAMNRAEPVEIEWKQGERGKTIDRVTRITRDALDPVLKPAAVIGLIVALEVIVVNQSSANGELHDSAVVALLTDDIQIVELVLDLQAPERLAVSQQINMLRDAYASGSLVRCLVDSSDDRTARRIIAVIVDSDMNVFGGDQGQLIDGFVEAISLLRTSVGTALTGSMAIVRLTTAPPFSGAGNVTSLSPFTPVTIELLTPQRAPSYELFLAGLRDNRRVRTRMVAPRPRDGTDIPPEQPDTPPSSVPRVVVRSSMTVGLNAISRAVTGQAIANRALAFAAELLAPLASASRPVWISVLRESLDHGPDAYPMAGSLPTSDLTPKTLRDLRIPYPATWRGDGCFNEGVYRFQLQLPSAFRLLVDDIELRQYPSDTAGVVFAHACLCGDHTVVVEIDKWTCESEFLMDVYRLR